MARQNVVFLDRDGTLVWDRPGFYLRRPDQLRLYSHSIEALKLLKKAGFRLIVVTNQSGIGHGFLDHATLGRIHALLRRKLARHHIKLDGIYFCPHTPEDSCRCRKPSTFLAKKALRELAIKPEIAAVIGDKKADVDLARRLGIASIHLGTGHGRNERAKHRGNLRPSHFSRNLLTAARWLLKTSCKTHFAVATSLLLMSLLVGAGVASAETSRIKPVEISSITIKEPYDLVRGTMDPTAELSSVPWFPETLEYNVTWGFIDVGTSNLRTMYMEDFNGAPAVRIVSEAQSNPFCDNFYMVRDLNESWIDARNFASLGYSKKLREGHFFRDEWVLFDYPNHRFLSKTVSRDGNYSFKSSTIPVPVEDILSSLYFLRTKQLHVGDEITLDVNTKENWPLVVRVLKKQRVKVPAGSFDCVVVQPFMRKEGIFIQKGRNLQIWMTDDARHLPVQMSVEVFFGHVTASLRQTPPPVKR